MVEAFRAISIYLFVVTYTHTRTHTHIILYMQHSCCQSPVAFIYDVTAAHVMTPELASYES